MKPSQLLHPSEKVDSEPDAENEVKWMQDMLPRKLPLARILMFDFPEKTRRMFKGDGLSVQDVVKDMLDALGRMRSENPRRPVIFFTYGLSGTLLEMLIITLNESTSLQCSDIAGIVFLSKPDRLGRIGETSSSEALKSQKGLSRSKGTYQECHESFTKIMKENSIPYHRAVRHSPGGERGRDRVKMILFPLLLITYTWW